MHSAHMHSWERFNGTCVEVCTWELELTQSGIEVDESRGSP